MTEGARKAVEIEKEDWILVTLFWLSMALFAFFPFFSLTFLGKLARRWFKILVGIHLLEGLLAGILARRKNLSFWEWFFKGDLLRDPWLDQTALGAY